MNRLVSAATPGSAVSLSYDPAGRLYQAAVSGGAATRFLYDGADMIAEYNGSNALLRRYVHGPGPAGEGPQTQDPTSPWCGTREPGFPTGAGCPAREGAQTESTARF
jgi:YD repeat-containing protein